MYVTKLFVSAVGNDFIKMKLYTDVGINMLLVDETTGGETIGTFNYIYYYMFRFSL